MPYMAFCEWVLLGNWSAVKRGALVLVFRMIKGTVSSTGAAELTGGIMYTEKLCHFQKVTDCILALHKHTVFISQ